MKQQLFSTILVAGLFSGIVNAQNMDIPVLYKTIQVSGLNIFYREAGTPGKPVLLLLHGFPSSSKMFEKLFPLLSDRYHLIAPDYPGFGYSDAPPPSRFAYTFDHIADIVDSFTKALNLTSYSMYVQDYGGPVGFRLITKHNAKPTSLIIQNAVSHEAGLGPLWETRRAFWKDRAAHEEQLKTNFTSLEATRQRHVGTNPHPERIDPDGWMDEYAFLTRPGQAARLVILDAGHFALDEVPAQIGNEINTFLSSNN